MPDFYDDRGDDDDRYNEQTADDYEAEQVEIELDRQRGLEPEFEPCLSCPWPSACAGRGGCEAD